MTSFALPPLFLLVVAVVLVIVLIGMATQDRRPSAHERACGGCGMGNPAHAQFCRRCGRKL